MDDLQKKAFLSSLELTSGLNGQEFQVLAEIFSARRLLKNQYLEKPGSDTSTVVVVISGLIRYYYLAEDGKEWNKAFVSAGAMSTSFATDFLGKNSPYAIQAMEDTSVLIADYSRFESLFDLYQLIERLGRKLLESILISKMNKERSFLQHSAKSRYEDFVREHQDFVGRIPQYHIASYLGVTEASLSRLLKTRD